MYLSVLLALQVATRLIMSSSPVVCWIAALVTTPSESQFVPITSADDLDWHDSKVEAKAATDEKGKRERERRLWFSVEKAKNLDARGEIQLTGILLIFWNLDDFLVHFWTII